MILARARRNWLYHSLMDRKSPPQVELLWFADCPNHEAVRESVRAILEEVAAPCTTTQWPCTEFDGVGS